MELTPDDAKVLLRFVPKHGRTSCDDARRGNQHTTHGRGGYPRCTRCLLLELADGPIGEPITLNGIDITRAVE